MGVGTRFMALFCEGSTFRQDQEEFSEECMRLVVSRCVISPDLVLQVMVEAGGVGVDISAP